MKNTKILLRLSLGFALFSFLLPFLEISSFMGSVSVSGLSFVTGGSNYFGGTYGPNPLIVLPFFCLLIAFGLSFLRSSSPCKWIGIFLSSVPALVFLILLVAPQGGGFISAHWAFGFFLCLIASVLSVVFGFATPTFKRSATPPPLPASPDNRASQTSTLSEIMVSRKTGSE